MLYGSYNVTCKNGHNLVFSVSELEEVLEWGNCPKCSANIGFVDPPEIQVECAFCGWEETNDWESVMGYFFSGCPRCAMVGEGECNTDSVHITGSFYSKVDFFEYYKEKVRGKDFAMPNRPDYWEIVIHFCKRDELISILDTQKVLANHTGYYGSPAVCLSEVPLIYSSELRKIHGDYGLAFRKKEILENGGQPAIYLTDDLIKAQENSGGFCDQVKPFINVVRIPCISPPSKRSRIYNFMHEREWRLPNSIDLSALTPVGLIFPEDDKLKFDGSGQETMIEYAFKYGELSQ